MFDQEEHHNMLTLTMGSPILRFFLLGKKIKCQLSFHPTANSLDGTCKNRGKIGKNKKLSKTANKKKIADMYAFHINRISITPYMLPIILHGKKFTNRYGFYTGTCHNRHHHRFTGPL